jgi:hypothetical protein
MHVIAQKFLWEMWCQKEKKTFCYRTRSEMLCCVRTVFCNSFHNLGFWVLDPSCFGTLLTVAIANSSCSGNLSSVAIADP